ncbi:two-component sensor histidine kinase [Vibrio vulnificus]|uniref:ATP-binding protein n=1 Tax=Vibrio vulnificus TaxID=672 RepID=UPI001CDBAA13|nr:ATP-binding protein [Vibrio vulnificus]ELK8587976.1 two-component sensor histidine kinase [Vibrio vulnificus]ELK8590790.1 two-component sensor histidine kinase [Vibrio vulnificus]MCA3962973.1 two-component sensor histidine kinase [Vibrio vulnificus]MDS1803992.1 ATP-binding protein [Vibrio vulnificus]
MRRSMFTCLYLELVIGLFVTVAVFLYFAEDYMRQTDLEIFLNDGSYFVDLYTEQRTKADSQFSALARNHYQKFYIFELYLLDNWDGSPPCDGCRLLDTLQAVPIYITEENVYLAVFPLPNSRHSLVFKETRDFFSPNIEWYEDSEIKFLLMLVTTMALSLALLVYVPLYRVRKRVDRLVALQKRFGEGELSVRSEIYNTSPLHEASVSFNMMAEEIESRVKQSQIFSQAIPHEIRTPLSRIQMASDLVRRKVPAEQQRLFDDIDEYIEDINELTSDVIQLSRLNALTKEYRESMRIEKSLLAFCECRTRLMSNGLGGVKTDGIRRSDVMVFESTLAKLVLDNLIKNAARYGHGRVDVTLRDFDCCWCIDVEDDGPGIPLDKRDEIFIAFARLDQSRNANSGGFGLGLAIASSAAKRLGWHLSVDDSHLGGARFSILIPNQKNGDNASPCDDEAFKKYQARIDKAFH